MMLLANWNVLETMTGICNQCVAFKLNEVFQFTVKHALYSNCELNLFGSNLLSACHALEKRVTAH